MEGREECCRGSVGVCVLERPHPPGLTWALPPGGQGTRYQQHLGHEASKGGVCGEGCSSAICSCSVFLSLPTPSFSSPWGYQLVNSFLEKASEKVLDSTSSDFTR